MEPGLDITWLPDAERRPRHVAVGEFDGVHLGHREVIRGADTVLTFEPHPRAVVAPGSAPKLLTSLEAKADLIAGLGVRELVVIPFDGAFAAQSPQAFIDDVLVAELGAERVSVGENFRFGHRAKGDAALLQAQDAFTTRVVELVEADGEVVSSSRIRGSSRPATSARPNRLLGAPFELRGPVAHGDKRGRTLGYPTANLVPDPARVCPAHGVYACRAAIEVDGAWRGGRRRRAWACARPSSPASACWRRRSCSASTATSTAATCGSRSSPACAARSASPRSRRWCDQMARDVEDTRRLAA